MPEPVMRRMREGEQEAVLDLLEAAFGMRGVFAHYMRHDPLFRLEDTLLALIDEVPISCVQIFSKRIRLRGETIPLGGIGSVATATAHRRQGLAGELVRRAIGELQRRGDALALLFAGLLRFYERLGFVSVPQAQWSLHRPEHLPDPPEGRRVRAFRPDDLGAVRDLYDGYSASYETSTVRDRSYWEGQLSYAGNPEEDFLVAERDGRVVAYARAVEIEGIPTAAEFARASGASAELAALLLAHAPAKRPLVCPRTPDRELDAALERAGARLEPTSEPATMWRVLDRPALARLAGLPSTTEDEDLLRSLVNGPRAVYWLSDRF